MNRIIFLWILILGTCGLSAQDEVHMLAGYHYTGKILSETEDKVNIRRNDNTVAKIAKPEIWKIVYDDGSEVVLNELAEDFELRIGEIMSQETLEEIIKNGEGKEAEVAYYFLIRRGYQYEFREKNLSDFSERYPGSKYRRELASMTRFKKKFKEKAEIGFRYENPYTPDVVDREANLNLQFIDQMEVSRSIEIHVLLKFIRTYGKKAKLNSGREWKNEYEISFIPDDSSKPVVFDDRYKLMDDQGDNPHMIFLNNVALGDLNLNGQIQIKTSILKDDGEYLIDIEIQVDYLNW
ncbi:MAG TPA: hypothetical protein ENI20_14715 [Bacteroides sp.]|nr:hypothetical protein [Bacteroides sp.]